MFGATGKLLNLIRESYEEQLKLWKSHKITTEIVRDLAEACVKNKIKRIEKLEALEDYLDIEFKERVYIKKDNKK